MTDHRDGAEDAPARVLALAAKWERGSAILSEYPLADAGRKVLQAAAVELREALAGPSSSTPEGSQS